MTALASSRRPVGPMPPLMWKSDGATPWKYSAEADDPRRRAQRHKVDSLTCDLGEVLDLSTVGMRIGGRGKPPLGLGQSGEIKLRIPEGSLTLAGRVVWVRRTGFRRFQMGVDFIHLKPSVTKALDLLGRFGFLAVKDPELGSTASAGATGTKPNPKVRASLRLPDYYSVLGLKSDASDDTIRSAFRDMARKFHPDINRDPNANECFMQIQEAYEVLKDATKRQHYDRKRAG